MKANGDIFNVVEVADVVVYRNIVEVTRSLIDHRTTDVQKGKVPVRNEHSSKACNKFHLLSSCFFIFITFENAESKWLSRFFIFITFENAESKWLSRFGWNHRWKWMRRSFLYSN
jgi:hypothetical protein